MYPAYNANLQTIEQDNSLFKIFEDLVDQKEISPEVQKELFQGLLERQGMHFANIPDPFRAAILRLSSEQKFSAEITAKLFKVLLQK